MSKSETGVKRQAVASLPDSKRQRSEVQGSKRPSAERAEESSSKRSRSESGHTGVYGPAASTTLNPLDSTPATPLNPLDDPEAFDDFDHEDEYEHETEEPLTQPAVTRAEPAPQAVPPVGTSQPGCLPEGYARLMLPRGLSSALSNGTTRSSTARSAGLSFLTKQGL